MQSPGRHISKIFTWCTDQDSPNPDGEQKIHANITMYKQKHWSDQTVHITLNTIQDLNLRIDYKGDPVTLHQALACYKTSGMGDYCLFSSINYIQRTGVFVAVCVNDYRDEAQSVIKNLVPLCREHFGKAVKIWFTLDA